VAPSFALDPYLAGVAARVEGELRRASEAGARGGPARLWEAMAYALLGGGKRLRPALVCATAEAFGADAGEGSLAIRFAASIEMIHT
jgi:farnesyl diphosphate synthase/geranylgeranyl diphosphate synthase type II